jgi:tetratricopeptide (TPR) repeat protein
MSFPDTAPPGAEERENPRKTGSAARIRSSHRPGKNMKDSSQPPGNWFLLVERLETKPIGFFPYLLSLTAIICTRNLLEAYSSTGFIEQAGSYLLHYPLAYIAPLLALSAALSLLSGVPAIRVTRIMLYVWLLTLLPPLLDILIARGTGREEAQIGYLAIAPGEYWSTFINFFNPRASLKGTTAGIRIEAFMACMLSLVYVFLKSRSILRALVTPFVIFTVSFFFFTFPHVYLALVKAFRPEVKDFMGLFLSKGLFTRTDSSRLSLLMAQVDLILTAAVILIWFGLYQGRRAMRQLSGLLTTWTSLFAIGMVATGFFIGWRVILPHESLRTLLSHHTDFLSLVSLLLAAVAASAALVIMEREEKGIEGASRGELGTVLVAFAAAHTLVVDFPPFCFLLLYLSAGIVRGMPPFSLKKQPFLSSLTLSVGGVALASMSYSLFAGSRTPSFFPKGILSLLLASLTVGFFALELWHARLAARKPAGSHLPVHGARLLGIAVLAFAFVLSYDDLPKLKNPHWGTPEEIHHTELGSMFASEGRRTLARIEYEEAVRLGSPDPRVYFELGLEHTKEGNDLLAVDMFRKATEMDPEYGEAHYNLALAYARAAMEDEAAKSFTRALSLLPGRAEVKLGTLAFLTEHDRLDEAFSLLLSGTMSTREEQVMAFEIMKRAAEQAGDAPVDTVTVGGKFLARFMESMQKTRRARWEEAVRGLARLKADYANVLPILYYEAWALQMRGSAEEARAGYELFLARVPGVYEAQINLGATYVSLGRLSEARAVFERLLSEKPDDTMALVNLANSYTKEGKLEESLALLERALETDSNSYLARVNMGIVLEGLSRTDEAITQYQTLLITRQETPDLYVRLASCYMRKGDIERTRENLQKALVLDPDFAPARSALASLSKQEGRTQEGIR